MAPIAKEILYFPGQSIQDLKVINQNTCEKSYYICSMYDRLLTFLLPPLYMSESSTF